MQIKLKLDVSKIELDGEYYCDEITHPEHKLPLRLAKELERARVIKSVREWMGARSINDIGWQYKLTNLLDYLEANEPD